MYKRQTLVNMPAVLKVALSMSLVPAISASVAERAPVAVRTKAETGLKLAILIGLPCAVGMYLMAEPILSMLYRTGTADEMAIAVELLGVMSIAVFFLSIVQTMTGVLQGLGKMCIRDSFCCLPPALKTGWTSPPPIPLSCAIPSDWV